MKTHYLTSLLFTLLLSTGLAAQDGVAPIYHNSLTLTVSLQQGYYKDKTFSPLNYVAGGTRFGLGYKRHTKNGHLFTADIGLGLGSLKTDVQQFFTTDRYQIDISVGYLRKAGADRAGRNLYVGGKYRSYVDISIFDDSEAISFFALHGLEVAAEGRWKTGERHQFRAAASLPVFGLLSRPPYTGWDKFIADNSDNIPKIVTRGDWTFLNNFTGLRAEVGWQYSLSNRLTMEANYNMTYYATKRIDPIRLLNNQFSLITSYNF